jgi:hypothetical protein
MSCPGQAGPSGESPSHAACRTAWYNAVADAYEKYENEEIDISDLSALLAQASADFSACISNPPP